VGTAVGDGSISVATVVGVALTLIGHTGGWVLVTAQLLRLKEIRMIEAIVQNGLRIFIGPSLA
jgi:hypothetical protein